MIKLCSIEGISRMDTLYFPNKESQLLYFSEVDGIYIEEGNYVPHFKNSIKVSQQDDIDVNSKLNYVIFNYQNKDYYYFIDSINYLNEDILELEITMDVIQTYMFDINYNYANVTRRSIDRWDGEQINRNYIRENLSQGNFLIDVSKNLSYKKIDTEYLLLFSFNLPYDESSPRSSTIQTLRDYNISDSQVYYLLPLLNKNAKYMNIILNGQSYDSMDVNDIEYIISLLCRNPYCTSIRLLNRNCFKNLHYKQNIIGINKYDLWFDTEDNTGMALVDMPKIDGITYAKDYKIPVLNNIETLDLEVELDLLLDNNKLEINTKKDEPYKSYFVPQLIDENYIEVKWGERLGYTGFPLSKLVNATLYLTGRYDIFTGERTYIVYSVIDDINDRYMTSVTNKTLETYPIYSNAEQVYYATNKGSLTTGVSLARQEALYSFAKGLISNTIGLGTGQLMASGSAGNYAPVKFAGATQMVRGASGILTTTTDLLQANYVIDNNLKVSKENAEFTPDTTKQGNSLSGDIINKSLDIFYSVAYVNDIENVGRKLEMYGYKVNEYYDNRIGNLVEALNTRYYYNIIQCADMDINLNCLSSEAIVSIIKDRFKAGLRFWNGVEAISIGTYEYDNVERKYL